MNPALVRRQAALAAVALLAALAAVALGRAGEGQSPVAPPAASPAAGWEEAVAGVIGSRQYGRETACGVVLSPEIRGVAHPVLPCGVDLVLSYEGREIRTEVIERGPYGGGREFDLTPALADDLGLEERQRIRWRFAG